MKESDQRAVVFNRLKLIEFRQEGGRWGDAITGVYDASEVGVKQGEQVVWSKTVTPFFVGLRKGPFGIVPKPFYAKRVEIAFNKAKNKADKINAA